MSVSFTASSEDISGNYTLLNRAHLKHAVCSAPCSNVSAVSQVITTFCKKRKTYKKAVRKHTTVKADFENCKQNSINETKICTCNTARHI